MANMNREIDLPRFLEAVYCLAGMDSSFCPSGSENGLCNRENEGKEHIVYSKDECVNCWLNYLIKGEKDGKGN